MPDLEHSSPRPVRRHPYRTAGRRAVIRGTFRDAGGTAVGSTAAAWPEHLCRAVLHGECALLCRGQVAPRIVTTLGGHVRDVSAEALCAQFHKPLPRKRAVMRPERAGCKHSCAQYVKAGLHHVVAEVSGRVPWAQDVVRTRHADPASQRGLTGAATAFVVLLALCQSPVRNLGRDQVQGPCCPTGSPTTPPSLSSCGWLRPTPSSSCASVRRAAATTASPAVECRPTRPVRADPPPKTIRTITATGTTTITQTAKRPDQPGMRRGLPGRRGLHNSACRTKPRAEDGPVIVSPPGGAGAARGQIAGRSLASGHPLW